jgi:hypothetical protein
MQNKWALYQKNEVSDKVALRKNAEATVKARRVWDESYVATVSRVSHVCSSESTFSIIPTFAPHTECHVGMKYLADDI